MYARCTKQNILIRRSFFIEDMNNDTTYNWIKIAGRADEIPFGYNGLTEMVAGEKSICLAKTKQGIRACGAKCPHAGAPMSDGKIDTKQNIVCCVHNYTFNLSNGRDTFGEGFFLKIYPVIENEDGVFVGFKKEV